MCGPRGRGGAYARKGNEIFVYVYDSESGGEGGGGVDPPGLRPGTRPSRPGALAADCTVEGMMTGSPPPDGIPSSERSPCDGADPVWTAGTTGRCRWAAVDGAAGGRGGRR